MKYSKDQLQEQAKEICEKLGVTKVYATSDGQFFQNRNRADLHSEGKMGVYELSVDGNESTGDEQSAYDVLMNAAKEHLNSMTDEEREQAAAKIKEQREALGKVIEQDNLEEENANKLPEGNANSEDANTSSNQDVLDASKAAAQAITDVVLEKVAEARDTAKKKAAVEKLPANSPEKRNGTKAVASKK